MPRANDKGVWVCRQAVSRRVSAASLNGTGSRKKSPRAIRRHAEEATHLQANLPKTLLWIDDYEPGLTLYKAMFENLGFRVFTASRGSAGLKLLASHRVDAVVVDYEMPEMNGEAVAAHIRNFRPEVAVVMFTGSGFVPNRVRNLVDGFCDKAGSRKDLVGAIQRALEFKSGHRSATPVYAA